MGDVDRPFEAEVLKGDWATAREETRLTAKRAKIAKAAKLIGKNEIESTSLLGELGVGKLIETLAYLAVIVHLYGGRFASINTAPDSAGPPTPEMDVCGHRRADELSQWCVGPVGGRSLDRCARRRNQLLPLPSGRLQR